MDSVPSRVEDILLALINNTEYDGPIISRVEQILYSFLENSEYTAEPESRVEAILVALKAAGLYDDAVISRIEKILYSKINGTEYTAEPESRVEELLLEWTLSEEKELTGVVPLLFTADGTPLIDYFISGNTIQNGTPTPDSPIMPEGTGERTGNLCNPNLTRYKKAYSPTGGGILDFEGGAVYLLPIEANTTYTVKIYSDESIRLVRVGFYNEDTPINGTFVTSLQQKDNLPNPTITVGNTNYKYIFLQIGGEYIDQYGLSHVMINTGSTPLPYEPYGVKIPISSAGQTTPIYLGEVETTRKIKKLVLTGEENDWRTSGGGAAQIFNHTIGLYADLQPFAICNIFYQSNNAAGYNNSFDIVRSSAIGVIRFNNSGIASTTAAWKSYLAAQYAAGTPVTVWYVLDEPETGIVNEPLMKIGDYADTLSMDQAGVEIPTVNGSNTLDVDTTVKPSEVYIKYKGR
jgi:hypothetical protein